jgi:hypothetical protein
VAERTSTRDNRAIIVPLPQMASCTMTATTEAGPRPGPATPSQPTGMALATTGTLDREVADITLSTYNAGNVGRSTLRWMYASEAAGTERNWDPPVFVSGWEFVDRSITAGKWTSPHVARIPSSGACVASVTKDSTGIACWRQSHSASDYGIWREASIATGLGGASVSCIVPLASGRLVCLYMLYVTSTTTQIQMAYSDDSGATWTIGSYLCLDTALAKASSDYFRIRGVELNGQISVLLWEQDTTDTIYQYVSTDGGASLTPIETFSAADKVCPDMAVSLGSIYVATVEDDGTYLRPYLRILSSASQPLSSVESVAAGAASTAVEWAIVTGAILTSSECALLVDDDGLIWLYGVNFDAGSGVNETIQRMSYDGGATWTANTINSVASRIYTADTTTYMKDLTVCAERGRACLLHRSVVAAVADDSLGAAFLGGWSNVGMPQEEGHSRSTPAVAGWQHLWLPIEKPETTAAVYTETLSGAATATLSSTGLTLIVAALEDAYYTAAPVTAGSANGIRAEFRLVVASGTAIHDVRISDGIGNDYSVRVSVTTTTATLRDLNAGADIGSLAIDATKGISLRISLDKPTGAWGAAVGRVTAWARQDGPSSGAVVNYGPRPDRVLTFIGSSSTLTAGVSATQSLVWGLVSGSSGQIAYRHVAYAGGAYATTSASSARGRIIPGAASPMHIVSGLRVHGTDGPTVGGDEWEYTTDHEYPVEAVNPFLHPSPRRRWRSTGVGQTDITLTGLDTGWRTGDPIGIYVAGTNIGTAALYRDAGAAFKVADLNFSAGVTGMLFTRSRDQVIPASGVGVDPSFHFHEGSLVGSRVDFSGGDIRKIAQCHAGDWLSASGPATYPSARLVLESYDAGDPASGSMSIRMQSALFIVESLQSTDTLMLRIGAQDASEGYFEIGTLLVGRVRPLAWQYGHGRSLGTAPSYALTTTRGGARHARRLAPARKSVTVSWDEGIVTTGIYTAGTAPDHITLGTTGGDAWGAPADTARMLPGIFEEVGGAAVPVLLVNTFGQISAATTATTPIQVTDPAALHFGRLMGETMRLEAAPNVVAEENRDPGEMFRVSVEMEHEL